MAAPLSDRALNRALLARQGLLERHELSLPAAARKALEAESEALLRVLHPAAKAHRVAVER